MSGSRLTRWFTESKLSWDYTLIRYNLGLVSLGSFLLAEVWILVISWPVMGPVHRSSKLSLQIRISWRYQCPVHLDWSWGPNIQVFTSSKLPNKLVLCDFYLSITKGQLPQGSLWPWTRWLSALEEIMKKLTAQGCILTTFLGCVASSLMMELACTCHSYSITLWFADRKG